MTQAPVRPRVTLVGAGPGDPELLTVKAVKAIRRATVLLVDDLVSDGVLRYARASARIVHVGKRGGGFCAPRSSLPAAGGRAAQRPRQAGSPSTPQAFIHKLMVAEARRGERVVRLKGGDPFVFGRGGEECDALREAGIEVDVVCGLTAGIAGPAAIGIPVTDRRHAAGVAFVTGHAHDGATGDAGPDWHALAHSGLTLVIYMGVARCRDIQRSLLDAGMNGHTPAAIISQACTAQQRQAVCTLAELADTLQRERLASPALLVVGDVLRAAPWFTAAAEPIRQPVAQRRT